MLSAIDIVHLIQTVTPCDLPLEKRVLQNGFLKSSVLKSLWDNLDVGYNLAVHSPRYYTLSQVYGGLDLTTHVASRSGTYDCDQLQEFRQGRS